MALKVTVHERCQYCGGRDARRYGDHIVDGHLCHNAPPGPAHAPRYLPVSQVNFVPAEWSAEELLAQRDEAEAEIHDLREEWSRFKARLDDIHVAMRGYTTNRIA